MGESGKIVLHLPLPNNIKTKVKSKLKNNKYLF